MNLLARHEAALVTLAERSRLRRLAPRAGHDFSSNDYLGLARSDVLREAAMAALARGVGVGAGGSRLLRGNDSEHEALEAAAARFFDAPRALFMGAGFAANQAIFAALPMSGDLVLHDALIHASTHDGIKLGRAETRAFTHNDANAAEEALRAWRAAGGAGTVWIAVESLYSMEGDVAPLADFAALAARFDAMLVVDEAHATGLHGPGGRGFAAALPHAENLVVLHTCGKALGVAGALICAAPVLIETLVNRARGFIFATAPSPLNAALVRAALGEVASNPARRGDALQLVARANALAEQQGIPPSGTQIIPVIIGEDARTMVLARAMQMRGFDIRGIRPPTVPRGTARLRLSITPNIDEDALAAMFAALETVQRA